MILNLARHVGRITPALGLGLTPPAELTVVTNLWTAERILFGGSVR